MGQVWQEWRCWRLCQITVGLLTACSWCDLAVTIRWWGGSVREVVGVLVSCFMLLTEVHLAWLLSTFHCFGPNCPFQAAALLAATQWDTKNSIKYEVGGYWVCAKSDACLFVPWRWRISSYCGRLDQGIQLNYLLTVDIPNETVLSKFQLDLPSKSITTPTPLGSPHLK